MQYIHFEITILVGWQLDYFIGLGLDSKYELLTISDSTSQILTNSLPSKAGLTIYD